MYTLSKSIYTNIYIKKINPSLQSRCISFRFTPHNRNNMRKRLKYIIKQEDIIIDKQGISSINDISNGDMRKAIRDGKFAEFRDEFLLNYRSANHSVQVRQAKGPTRKG